MKKIYRIYILGDTPTDLKERIASIHAAAILAQRNGGPSGSIKNLNSKNIKKI